MRAGWQLLLLAAAWKGPTPNSARPPAEKESMVNDFRGNYALNMLTGGNPVKMTKTVGKPEALPAARCNVNKRDLETDTLNNALK
jgi:hypothetical protein